MNIMNKLNPEEKERAFKDAVWKEGFSFEQHVFRLLEKRGWFILPNRYFHDSFSGRTREYDILAGKIFETKGVTLFLVVIIECKFNPFKIVFYARSLKEEKYPFQYYVGGYMKNYISYESLENVFKKMKKHRQIFYPTEQIFGYQAFEENQNKKNGKTKIIFKAKHDFVEKTIFGAINNVIQATKYEGNVRDKQANLTSLILYFPVVIFSDNIYKANLIGKKKTIVKRHLFQYKAGMAMSDKTSPTDFYVHICDMEALGQLLNAYEYIFNRFGKLLQSTKFK